MSRHTFVTLSNLFDILSKETKHVKIYKNNSYFWQT